MLLSLLCAVILQCTPTQALAHAIYKKLHCGTRSLIVLCKSSLFKPKDAAKLLASVPNFIFRSKITLRVMYVQIWSLNDFIGGLEAFKIL